MEEDHARRQQTVHRQKRGAHQVALNHLWDRLPKGDRQEIALIVAQMIAVQILPPRQKEGSDET